MAVQRMPVLALVVLMLLESAARADEPETLPGTEPLTWEGDLSERMLDGLHRFAERKIAEAPAKRPALWKRDLTSVEAYAASVAPNRERLRRVLGVVDERVPVRMERWIGDGSPLIVARTDRYRVFRVRWPVLDGVTGEGLLLEPKDINLRGNVVALPDADQTPEQIAGLAEGVPPESQFARRLAENGFRVVVPVLIDRSDEWSEHPDVAFTNQPHREWIWRQAYHMGRHVIGYEVQKVLAAVDWFHERFGGEVPAGVAGYGEGGLIAFCAAAVDPRVDACLVSGCFEPHEQPWEEPIDRHVWSLYREFGDAEIASLVAPRGLVVEHSPFAKVDGPPPARDGRRATAAAGRLTTPEFAAVRREFERIDELAPARLQERHLVAGADGAAVGPGSQEALQRFAALLGADTAMPLGETPPVNRREAFNPADRQRRQVKELEALLQRLVRDSDRARDRFFMNGVLKKPTTLDAFENEAPRFRAHLWDEVIGRLHDEPLPAHPRTRKIYDTPKWTGYEVVLDVLPLLPSPPAGSAATAAPPLDKGGVAPGAPLRSEPLLGEDEGNANVAQASEATPPAPPCQGGEPDEAPPQARGKDDDAVFAWGVLLVPKGIKPGERRPVVVCQHGRNGLPCDVIEGDNPAYHDFAAKLAERGFIAFAPHNPYRGEDRYRYLDRKAGAVGTSLFSFILAQHRQILDWLKTLPEVDPDRIGFYGLSYGGATAVMVPPLLEDYRVSVCSAVFNDWTRKIASTDAPFTFLFTVEWEMFDFNMGPTFSHAELAALMVPRPFMVERGHEDGVSWDEWVAYEYAKVRRLYVRLGLGDRTEIEFFDGPHTIHGQGTFRFLHRHLDWPVPEPP